MRLRQVALVARDLEPVRQALESVFGLQVAYRDPGVATYGLINIVIPFGGEFIEVVQPVTTDASAGRLLAKRGGDAGYMLIFQAPDAVRHRARFAARGIRNIAELNTKRYTFTHFHPADVDGVLTSIDTEGDGTSWDEPRGSWTPAGPDWRAADAGPDIVGLLGATVQVPNPLATAIRWAELFEGRLEAGANPRVALDRGYVSFVGGATATGIVALDLAVRDPKRHLDRGQALSLRTGASSLRIGGMEMRVLEAS